MGNISDPLSLHKYLYTGSDPVNHIDPSGHFFSLSEVAATLNIRLTISNMQIDTGMILLDVAIDPGSATENFAQSSQLALGLGVLGGQSFKLLKMLSGKFRQACNSFGADTGIWTEDGIRSIDEIKIGEKIWAFNQDTQQIELQDVVHLIQTPFGRNAIRDTHCINESRCGRLDQLKNLYLNSTSTWFFRFQQTAVNNYENIGILATGNRGNQG